MGVYRTILPCAWRRGAMMVCAADPVVPHGVSGRKRCACHVLPGEGCVPVRQSDAGRDYGLPGIDPGV